MYIYVDETIFSKNGTEYYGVGAFITDKKITNKIICSALETLRNDSDINLPETKQMDYRTLERRFFHAADDSKNAHSHLCRVIKQEINGEFRYTYFSPILDSQLQQESVESIHRLSTMLSILEITHYRRPVNIIIEERSGFTQGSITHFFEDFYNQLDRSCYNMPFLSASYPRLNVTIGNKNEPGLQIVDFILWAVNNQENSNAKSKWIERLGFSKFKSSYQQQGGGGSGGTINFNSGVRAKEVELSPYPESIFPLNESHSYEAIFNYYALIERTLHFYSLKGIPKHAQHFEMKLRELANNLRYKKTLEVKELREVAKLFIRLFDTIPIYKGMKKESRQDVFKKIVYARHYAALILRQDLINGVLTTDFIILCRENVWEHQPKSLGIVDSINEF